jgi:Leucine-rich repeat (LRR) protein
VPRFRLQTLLVLVTAFCVVLGLIAREWHPAHRQKQAAAEVQRRGGRVRLADPPEATGVISGWLHLVLGDEYFAEVCSVTWSPGSEEDLELLHAFPRLTGLRLAGPAVTDAALRRLKGLAQLNGLTLDGGVLSEHGLESLTELPNLIFLELANCSLSDDSLKALYGAPSLVELRLRETNVTEPAILALRAANPALAVSFGSSRSKEDPENHLPSVQQLPDVKKLAFKGPRTSDATLAVLKDARSLTALRLVCCRVTDEGLASLRSLTQLTRLEVGGTNVSDTVMSDLRKQPEFADLARSDCQITDRGLEQISHLSNLTDLAVCHCPITDDGVRQLAAMTSLRHLNVSDTAVSDVGVAELQRALPGCKIINQVQAKH